MYVHVDVVRVYVCVCTVHACGSMPLTKYCAYACACACICMYLLICVNMGIYMYICIYLYHHINWGPFLVGMDRACQISLPILFIFFRGGPHWA